MEVWKVIPNTKGKIWVSNEGRMRSFLRDDRILKATPDKKGYLRVRVTIDRKKYSYKVHREVAKAFLPEQKGKPQVNHKDGNKSNNAVSNLEWVNNLENARHAIENGLWGNVFEASRRTCERLRTPIIAIDIKTGQERRFNSVCEAERYFNSRHISDVLNGKRNAAAGHRFQREVV